MNIKPIEEFARDQCAKCNKRSLALGAIGAGIAAKNAKRWIGTITKQIANDGE